MPSKVDANKDGVTMGLNDNTKELGETNRNVVHNDEHATAPEQTHFAPESQIDNSTLSTMTSRSSTIHSKSSTSLTSDKRYPSKNVLKMISSPFQ